MKIRNGFVSNSSSSSFIIAIAEVVNEEALKEFLKNEQIGAEIVSDSDFTESNWYGCRSSENAKLKNSETRIVVDSFEGSEVSLPYDKVKKYLTYYQTVDSDCNDDGETIYDDSIDDNEIFVLSSKPELVTNFQYTTGCGRNG